MRVSNGRDHRDRILCPFARRHPYVIPAQDYDYSDKSNVRTERVQKPQANQAAALGVFLGVEKQISYEPVRVARALADSATDLLEEPPHEPLLLDHREGLSVGEAAGSYKIACR